MEYNIKPIETKYKGILFRSRLEARWAVYFDLLSFEWIYEYEGFELSDGSRYLPDFYFPESKMWVEVKPIKVEDERLQLFANGIKVTTGHRWNNFII